MFRDAPVPKPFPRTLAFREEGFPKQQSRKKIRDDKGYWEQVDVYVRNHSDAEFTHGLCPDCVQKLYPELDEKQDEKK